MSNALGSTMAHKHPEMIKISDGDEIPSNGLPVVSNRNTYLATCSAFMYIIVMGMTGSFTACATVDMKRPGSRMQGITADEVTWIGSLTLVGGLPANILGGYASHKLGRKAVLILTSPLFLFSWLMIVYAPTVEWIYAGRIISGFCTGLYVIASQAYVTEIAPREIRGKLSSGFPFAVNLGLLVMLGLGIVLRWTWMAVIIAILITVSAGMMVFMPESPVWLVKESRLGEAVNGLRFLRGKKSDFKKEVQEIVENLRAQEQSTGISLKDLKNPTLYKPLAISLVLFFFHQASGSQPLSTYTVEIFQNAGSAIAPDVAATMLGAVQLCASVVCGGLIDKYGRRKLYLISGVGTTLVLLINGAHSLLIKLHPEVKDKLGFIPLITFPAFAFIFAVGLGTVPFVMMPEMVSVKYRSFMMSFCVTSVSLFSFSIVKSYEILRSTFGDSGLYWIFAFCTSLSVPFGYFFLPETKNLSIEEIAQSFSKDRKK